MGQQVAQVNPVIRIQNIYHMLAYAFQTLQGQGYRDIAAEEFDNTADLLAEILSRGVSCSSSAVLAKSTSTARICSPHRGARLSCPNP